MTSETRELYSYITTVEPFISRYNNLSTEMISLTIATRGLVKDAISQYGKDYGNGNGFEIFSEDDFEECVDKIIDDVEERCGVEVVDEYVVKELARYAPLGILLPNQVSNWRKPSNGIEAEGVIWMASKWIAENIPEETIKGAYDNIHGWRDNCKGGSFNVDENFRLYDTREILEISDVILCGSCVYLEVWNTEEDKAVGYISIN